MRYLLMAVALLIAIGVLGIILSSWWATPTHRITAEAFEQLREGQMEAEVADLLGGPPGDYTHGRKAPLYPRGTLFWRSRVAQYPRVAGWVGEEMAILAWVDAEGRVGFLQRLQVYDRSPPTLFDWFLDWLRP